MGILSTLFDRLRNRGKAVSGDTGTTATPEPTPVQQPASQAQPTQASTAAPLSDVDMEAVLEDLAAKNPQKLNWRTSIVDLMKLLGMDSSLQERKALADELGYSGDKGDSAAMNIWLHKQVMRRVADNGGKVPANLLD